MSDTRGKAVTALGPVEPRELGITLPHEHIFLDLAPIYFKLPDLASERKFAREPITLENLAWVRFNPYSNYDNLRLDDEEVMVQELMRFRALGGKTVVDASSVGLTRDPVAYKRVSIKTGLNIVVGSGYYVSPAHPPGMDAKSVETIKDEIVRDVENGIQNTGIRAGLIGEIGTSYPWGPNEQKVLEAAAGAQAETGAPMEVHPGRHRQHPGMILDICEKHGADPAKIVICHIERTLFDLSDYKALLARGCSVEFDMFGQAWYAFPNSKLDFVFPSDSARVFRIKELVEAGYADRIFASMDIDSKIWLCKYGGHGYDHVLRNIVPLLSSVISPENVQKIIVDNPKRFLTFE